MSASYLSILIATIIARGKRARERERRARLPYEFWWYLIDDSRAKIRLVKGKFITRPIPVSCQRFYGRTCRVGNGKLYARARTCTFRSPLLSSLLCILSPFSLFSPPVSCIQKRSNGCSQDDHGACIRLPIRDIFRYVGGPFVCKSEKKSSLLHVQSSMELWNRYRRFDLSCLWTVSSMIFIRGRGEMPLKKRTSDPVGNGDSVSFAESNSCQTCRPANFVVNNKLLLLFF